MAKFRFIQWFWDWLLELPNFTFEWDAGNSTKSFQKHGLSIDEAEEVFTRRKFIPLGEQYQPPSTERRFGVLGETKEGRVLFVAFTFRAQRIRVISARAANEREQKIYEALRQE